MICLLLSNLQGSLSASDYLVESMVSAVAKRDTGITYIFSKDTHDEMGGKLAPFPQYCV